MLIRRLQRSLFYPPQQQHLPSLPPTFLLPRLQAYLSSVTHTTSPEPPPTAYLLTQGDQLRLPFLMPSAPVGATLRLTRASALGSREFSFRGAPWVDERVFVCRARVVGVESEPMRRIEKTKRRQRHVRTVKSKLRFTVLRCCELRVVTPEGEMEVGGRVVRE